MKNIYQRLAQAMGQVKYIQNEQRPGMRYRIVSHDAVTAKCRPALLDAGIVYFPVSMEYAQEGTCTQVLVTVRFQNVDDKEDFIDVPSLGFGVDNSDKGPGKAVSYAVKYAVLKTLALETGEDADLEASPADPDHKAVFSSLLKAWTGVGGSDLKAVAADVMRAATGATLDQANSDPRLYATAGEWIQNNRDIDFAEAIAAAGEKGGA